MDPELKRLLDEMNRAHTEFRAANDERIAALEKRGTADPLLVSKVDAANDDITRLSAEMKETMAGLKLVETANARIVRPGSADARDKEITEVRAFLRMTKPQPVDSLKPIAVSDDDVQTYRAYKDAFWNFVRYGERALRDTDVKNALTSGVTTEGGYWLTPDTSGKIVEFLQQISGMRQLATVQPIGTDTFEGMYDLDLADSGWVGEQDARTETNAPRVDGKYQIQVFEQYANPKASQKTLDDTQFNVEAWLARKVADRFALRENDAFANGGGTYGPRGFLTYGAATPARTSVKDYRVLRQFKTGVNGDFAATPNGGDIFLDMIQGMVPQLRSGGSFAMNPLTVAAVRKLKDSNGHYTFIPNFAENPNGSILGYAINELTDMPVIATNALAIAFANWKEFYTILDHQVGVRVLRDPFSAKPFVQFYTTKRVGGDVVNFQACHILKFST